MLDTISINVVSAVDPDISTGAAQPKGNEWHQWLVGNIPGGDVSAGETLTAYVGSGPPPKTGNLRKTHESYTIYKRIIMRI